MATSKFYLDRRSKMKDGRFPLKISVSHKGKTTLISLGVALAESQWDENKCKITGIPERAALNSFITRRKLEVDTALLDMSETGGEMDVSSLKKRLASAASEGDGVASTSAEVGDFVREFRKFIGMKEKPRTREIYEYTLCRMYKFCPELDKMGFGDVTKEWLMAFDRFLAVTSPSRNARNIHFRNIRAVFNEAIDDGVTVSYPFRKFKIRPEATRKRSLSVERLRDLFAFPVEDSQRKYLDMFKLIFFLIGINIVDLCKLKEIDEGRVEFRRSKTNRLYSVKVEPEAEAIIERYRGKGQLLDIMDRYADYKDYAKKLNDNLQRIGHTTTGKHGKKIFEPMFPGLTTYWARHTWATIAASLDIPKETIAHALGHGGNTVTDIYIDFDQKKVDEANRKVIDYVLYGKRP